MKVKVLPPVQVCHAGAIYRPGDTAEVSDEVGHGWLVSEWVEPADAGSKRAKAAIDAAREAQAARLAAGGEPAPDASADEFGNHTSP